MPAIPLSACFTWGERGSSYCFQLSLVTAGESESVHAVEEQNVRPWAGGTRAVGRTGRGVGPSRAVPGPVHGVGSAGMVRRAAMASCRSVARCQCKRLPFLPACARARRQQVLTRSSGGRRGERRVPGAARRQRPAAGKTKGSHVLRAARLPGAPGESAAPRPAGARPRSAGCRWGGTCRARDAVF